MQVCEGFYAMFSPSTAYVVGLAFSRHLCRTNSWASGEGPRKRASNRSSLCCFGLCRANLLCGYGNERRRSFRMCGAAKPKHRQAHK